MVIKPIKSHQKMVIKPIKSHQKMLNVRAIDKADQDDNDEDDEDDEVDSSVASPPHKSVAHAPVLSAHAKSPQAVDEISSVQSALKAVWNLVPASLQKVVESIFSWFFPITE